MKVVIAIIVSKLFRTDQIKFSIYDFIAGNVLVFTLPEFLTTGFNVTLSFF